jgi:uncharacterized protein (DUF58 family)
MLKKWRQLRRWLARDPWPQGRPQRVTRTGVAYAGTLLLVAIAAMLSANNLLVLILAAMISTLLVSGFVSRLGLAALELDLVLPQHISARRRVRAGVRLRNLKRWFPSFSIHLAGAAESGFDSILYFPVLPSGASVEEPVDVYFARRGSQKERSFQFSTRFPFGFAERREMVTARHEILVYPCLDPQPGFEELLITVAGELEALRRGQGVDFYRIRPYEATESARHVDWKISAHTGDLQVREFAQEQDLSVAIFLDLNVAADDSAEKAWFEKAVECAAFLAVRLTARGVRLRFRSQEADVMIPETADVYAVLKYLAVVEPGRNASAAAPDETSSYQIVFSARPERMAALGWGEDRSSKVLGPSAFEERAAGGSVVTGGSVITGGSVVK